MSRLVVAAAVGFAVALAGSGVARADRVDDLMLKLRGDSDYKVRLSAALNLGKLGDRRALPALLDALRDSDRSVRAVAAGALAKVVDARVAADTRARVVAALEDAAASDPDESVRAQARRTLEVVHGPAPGAVFVEVGAFGDRTQRGGAIVPLMRQSMVTGLQKRPGLQVHLQGDAERAPAEGDLKRLFNGAAFYVDAALTRADVTGGHVACAVSLFIATYPGKSMFAFASGSAELDAVSSAPRAVSDALATCVVAVVDDLVATKILPTIQSRLP